MNLAVCLISSFLSKIFVTRLRTRYIVLNTGAFACEDTQELFLLQGMNCALASFHACVTLVMNSQILYP